MTDTVWLETAGLAPEFGMRIMEVKIQKLPKLHPVTAPTRFTDRYGRTFNYLRIALNEQCNLRCIYCMPEEGIEFSQKSQLLSKDEILRIIRIVASSGIEKIRLTGGEPLMFKELGDLIRQSKEIDGIQSIHITTNGVLLKPQIKSLYQAGLDGINISLDTFNREKYHKITRRDDLNKVLGALNNLITDAFIKVKINMVALKGFNDNEIVDFVQLTKAYPVTVRFIELMPYDSHQIWKTGKYFSCDNIIKKLKLYFPDMIPAYGSSTEYFSYKIPGYLGKLGVIPAYTRTLCGTCSRIRLTADGRIRNCLYSDKEYNLKKIIRAGASEEEIRALFMEAVKAKQVDGWAAQREKQNGRDSMTQIGG